MRKSRVHIHIWELNGTVLMISAQARTLVGKVAALAQPQIVKSAGIARLTTWLYDVWEK